MFLRVNTGNLRERELVELRWTLRKKERMVLVEPKFGHPLTEDTRAGPARTSASDQIIAVRHILPSIMDM